MLESQLSNQKYEYEKIKELKEQLIEQKNSMK